MSREDVVRGLIGSILEGDREAWAAPFSEQIEYTPVREWPEATTLHGTGALWDFLQRIIADWGEWELRVSDAREHGDRVLLELTIRSVGRTSGIELKGRVFNVFTFEGDEIVRLQDFLARSDAYRAAGLDPP